MSKGQNRYIETKMAERKLLEYREFRKYLETGEAVAVDFIIRDPNGGGFFENPSERIIDELNLTT